MFLVLLVVAVVSGVASMKIAEAKGHNGTGYFFLGFLLPIVGILVAGFMPPAESTRYALTEDEALRLAQLRSPDHPTATAFLNSHGQRVSLALRYCKPGEHVLAYGTGAWQYQHVIFLLTDRRFVFVEPAMKYNSTVTQLEGFSLDETTGMLRSTEGPLKPDQRSPFTAHELDARIQRRREFTPYVEVVAPGHLATSLSPSGVDGSAAAPNRSATSPIGELERLDALHRSGAINDDEFAELKRRAMWGDEGGGQ